MGIIKKVHKFGPKLVKFRKVHKFECSQVWAQTCEVLNVHKFGPKLVNILKFTSLNLWTLRKFTSLGANLWTFKPHRFRPKLVKFHKVHKFKCSKVWAQTCEHSKVHKFKLVNFTNIHKFGPKLVNFLNNSQMFFCNFYICYFFNLVWTPLIKLFNLFKCQAQNGCKQK